MFGPKQERDCTPLHDKSRLLMHGLQSTESPSRDPLTARESDAADDACGAVDLLIQGLVNRLPRPDSTWSLDDRAKWLRTAAGIFGLVYKTRDGDHGEISIVLAKDESADRPMAGRHAAGSETPPRL
jgi:hypothetical protein